MGVRYFAGDVADAYLVRADIQRGLSIVVWRGRHVVEPTELSDEEAAAYGREVLAVGRALETTFSAVKMNYNLLGNWVPHLHTHIVPRYADDPRPGWPFPFPSRTRSRCRRNAWRGTWRCCARRSHSDHMCRLRHVPRPSDAARARGSALSTVVIAIYCRDRHPPHFHASYGAPSCSRSLAELAEEGDGGFERFHHDADVVHP